VDYEVVMDNESSEPPEHFSIRLQTGVTAVTVPAEFIVPGSEYKFEILVSKKAVTKQLQRAALRPVKYYKRSTT